MKTYLERSRMKGRIRQSFTFLAAAAVLWIALAEVVRAGVDDLVGKFPVSNTNDVIQRLLWIE